MRFFMAIGLLLFLAAGVIAFFTVKDFLRARERRAAERRRREDAVRVAAQTEARMEPAAVFALGQAHRSLLKEGADAEALVYLQEAVVPAVESALRPGRGPADTLELELELEMPETNSPQAQAVAAWCDALRGARCTVQLASTSSPAGGLTLQVSAQGAFAQVYKAQD